MLENAIRACPDALWSSVEREPYFWSPAYHKLFYLDLYLSDRREGFAPPALFTLSELDPVGPLPARVYRKEELLSYLAHCRAKARARIAALTPETANDMCRYGWIELTTLESLLYNMRHVQHHVAQLNLLLRQNTNAAPGWVSRARP